MKKISDLIKNNWTYILLTLISIAICILTFKVEFAKKDLQLIYAKNKYLGYAIIFITGVIISSGIYYMFYKKMKIEKIFLVLIIPIGLLYMTIIPIGRVPDEAAHFYRAYEISNGHLISLKDKEGYGGDYLPANIRGIVKGENNYKEEIKKINTKPIKKKEFITFTNTALYSFITYIPQSIGISIGKLFNLSFFWIAYLGRLTNFLVWLIFMYYSIKLIPFKKLAILITAFMPMMLQETASLSADAITNGATFFFVSYILFLKYNRTKKITSKNKIILAITTIIMSVSKIVYLPLCLLVFLIPKEKFKSAKQKYLQIGLLAFIVIAINLFFFSLSISYNAHVKTTEIINIDTALQIKHILSNPLGYIVVMFRTIYEYSQMYVSGFIGESLCWYDVAISNFFTKIISSILIIVLVLDTSKINYKDKILNFIATFFVILLIFTSEYLTWTEVGSKTISGIQGRYFIPLIIPLLVLFNFNNLRYNLNKIYKYLLTIIVFINISTLITLFAAHIG